jgi:CRISPR system Cascade subunit CasD
MQVFTMRLVAPIATIRGPVVGDGRFPAQPIPSSSMLVGMLGAALGVDRREHARLQRMQDAIEVAWLVHREPRTVTDYQTTDLSRSHMRGPMWACDGERAWTEQRAGGDALRTLVSERDLTCDVDLTAVIGWHLETPDAAALLAALDQPAMPLSIGARWALPTEPTAGEIVDAASLAEAVAIVREQHPAVRAYVPINARAPYDAPLVAVTASCDWRTRRHTGSAIYGVMS